MDLFICDLTRIKPHLHIYPSRATIFMDASRISRFKSSEMACPRVNRELCWTRKSVVTTHEPKTDERHERQPWEEMRALLWWQEDKIEASYVCLASRIIQNRGPGYLTLSRTVRVGLAWSKMCPFEKSSPTAWPLGCIQ